MKGSRDFEHAPFVSRLISSRSLAPTIVNLRTKFEVPSFTGSK